MPEPSLYHYTGEDTVSVTGEEAKKRLAKVNDAQYLREGQGVVQVPQERWRVAQKFERTGWMETWADASDDRNVDHYEGFNGYRGLLGRRFDHAIELGCGPFTNMRVIAGLANIGAVTLLDPLLESYLGHPHATYDRTRLRTMRSLARWAMRKRTIVRRAVRKAIRNLPALGVGNTPLRELLASPIETMPARPAAYDLVVIINVIEHCFDLQLIFDRILEITKPDGLLVFHDDLYDHEIVAKMLNGHHYEAGHPLMADGRLIERFLQENFEPVFEQYGSKPLDHPILKNVRTVYFIGRRKA